MSAVMWPLQLVVLAVLWLGGARAQSSSSSSPAFLENLKGMAQSFTANEDEWDSSRTAFRPFVLQRLQAQGASVPSSKCGAFVRSSGVLGALRGELQSAFTRAALQDGDLSFGFLGTEDETAACGGQNCAYTNPSSPYGILVLPLAPTESVAAKLAPDSDVPDFVRKDMADRSKSSTVPPASRGPSAAWQLGPSEAVVLAGCLPPARASRYFAFTNNLHSLYDEGAGKWVTVFASTGDSIGVVQQPSPRNGTLPNRGTRNRLNSTLPQQPQQQQQQPKVTAFSGAAGGGGLLAQLVGAANSSGRGAGAAGATPPSGLLAWLTGRSHVGGGALPALPPPPPAPQPKDVPPQQLPRQPANNTSARPLWPGAVLSQSAQQLAFAGEAGGSEQNQEEDAFDSFTVVILTASPATAQRVRAAAAAALASSGLQRASGAINVLPVAPPFDGQVGLGGTHAYFMLLARNILGAGQMDAFKSYLASDPFKAWRVSPPATGAGAWLSRVLPQRGGSGGSAGAGFPPAAVVPRLPATAANQNERWLEPAWRWLLSSVNATLGAGGTALSWSLGSGSALQSAGVDWGVDCFKRKLDFCNGDNRDAQYLTSLPLVAIDPAKTKALYVVGVNHVATGLASISNIAPSDPVQRLGLASWDDQEMRGSAAPFLEGGPYAGLDPFFYVVAYARNCTGIPFCKVLPSSGARSLPVGRRMLMLERAYVNPVTGVGPDASAIIGFRTVVATGAAVGAPNSVRAVASALLAKPEQALVVTTSEAVDPSPCRVALTSLAVGCPSALMPLGETQDDASGGGAGGVRRAAAGGERLGAAARDRFEKARASSDCCASAAAWSANTCWCVKSGQALLDALSPLPARPLVASVLRVCGQPLRTSLANCTR